MFHYYMETTVEHLSQSDSSGTFITVLTRAELCIPGKEILQEKS